MNESEPKLHRQLELAAEAASPPPAPDRDSVLLDEIRALAYRPYQLLTAKLEEAKKAGFPPDQYERFHERIRQLFLEKHTEAELPYIFDGLPPSVEMMRTLMERLIPELPPPPDGQTIRNLQIRPQSQYMTYRGEINGVVSYEVGQGDSISGHRSLPIHNSRLVTEWRDEQGKLQPIRYTRGFENIGGHAYALLVVDDIDKVRMRQLLIVDDQVVEIVDGQRVGDVDEFYPEPEEQTWSGLMTKYDLREQMSRPVIHGRIKEQFSTGQEIRCVTHTSHQHGELSGAMIAKERVDYYDQIHLLVNGQEMETIEGRRILQVYALFPGEGDKFDGIFYLSGEGILGDTVLVLDGRIEEDLRRTPLGSWLGGRKTQILKMSPAGSVSGSYGQPTGSVPIVKEEMLREIGGYPIETAENLKFTDDGELDSGIICFQAGEDMSEVSGEHVWGFVIDGKFVKSIDGRAIRRIDLGDLLLFDGTLAGLTGKIRLQGEDRWRRYLLGEWEYVDEVE